MRLHVFQVYESSRYGTFEIVILEVLDTCTECFCFAHFHGVPSIRHTILDFQCQVDTCMSGKHVGAIRGCSGHVPWWIRMTSHCPSLGACATFMAKSLWEVVGSSFTQQWFKASHNTPQHRMAEHIKQSRAYFSATLQCVSEHSKHSTAQRSAAQNGTAQHSTANEKKRERMIKEKKRKEERGKERKKKKKERKKPSP